MASTTPATLAVSLTQFNSATADFTAHYALDQCGNGFGGTDIQVPWSDFAAAVNDFIAVNKIRDSKTVALRFVHCYDGTDLYLRLQILTMTLRQGSNIYDLNDTPPSPVAWYRIDQNGINSTTDTELEDTSYLENFYYSSTVPCDAASQERLAGDGGTKFARNFVLAWGLQVSNLDGDNGNPQGASVNFAASAFFNSNLNLYQHCCIIYLREANGTALLNDVIGPVKYEGKGCDMATMCPPTCHVYQA